MPVIREEGAIKFIVPKKEVVDVGLCNICGIEKSTNTMFRTEHTYYRIRDVSEKVSEFLTNNTDFKICTKCKQSINSLIHRFRGDYKTGYEGVVYLGEPRLLELYCTEIDPSTDVEVIKIIEDMIDTKNNIHPVFEKGIRGSKYTSEYREAENIVEKALDKVKYKYTDKYWESEVSSLEEDVNNYVEDQYYTELSKNSELIEVVATQFIINMFNREERKKRNHI